MIIATLLDSIIKTVESIHRGGPVMYVILALLVGTIGIIIERSLALRQRRIINVSLVEDVEKLSSSEDLEKLVARCRQDDSSLARLIETALDHLSWPKSENMEAIQTRGRLEVNRQERGLVFLEMAVGIGPLLGLLGTVKGLMAIFEGLSNKSTETQMLLVAQGIAEALNNTVAGLVVAIPALVAWSYFSRKVESNAVLMENVCASLLSKLYRSE